MEVAVEDRPIERRLAAILAADMVGYSRLMEADEAGTLARLKAHRLELFDPTIAKSNGRIIKTTGDGMLVEFSSVVEAVNCAIEIQRRMARRNTDVVRDRRIDFRIGINLGDIMVDADDIYGDGVNVAARLQGLSDPGGIYISGAVREQVAERVDAEFEDLGEQNVKNIARSIRVFNVRWNEENGIAMPPPIAGVEAAPADKPSIAVLPFDNMSGDPEQEFFADGLTEDVITELSRVRELFVIARNSAFVYKGKAVNIQQVAADLRVEYVIEGSVRKAGDRVRVTVQLIDAETARHVWAERYDRQLEDIFAIQDEITSAIVATLPGRIQAATHERTERKVPENMAAYEFVLAGRLLHHESAKEANEEAVRLLDRAIELDPKYAPAHAWRACTLGQAWVYGWCEDRDATWREVLAELKKAISLDDNDSDVHRILAAVSLAHGDHKKASYHQERGLRLNPNNDLIVVQQGELLTWLGRPEEGVEWIQKAMRLNPYHPERFWNHLGRAYYVARRYAEAIEALNRMSSQDSQHHALLAVSHAQLGDAQAAEAHARKVLEEDPGFTVEQFLKTLHYKSNSDLEHHREGLLKAGLPPS